MIALAILGSVGAVVAGGLVGWKWWLAHLAAERNTKTRNIDAELAKVAALEQQVVHLEKRLQSVEIRTAGR
ncbi:MAG: hypothetical protein Q8K32_11010 [Archangium sp.]|nr:hypothetical protein [Archangium sp.]